MKKIFLNLLAAILYICSVGVSYAGVKVTLGFHENTTSMPKWREFTGSVSLLKDNEIIATKNFVRQDITVSNKKGEKSIVVFENIEPGTYTVKANDAAYNNFLYESTTSSNGSTLYSVTVAEVDKEALVRLYVRGMQALITVVYRDTVITEKTPADAENEATYDTVINLVPIEGATILAGPKGEAKTSKTTDENGQISERYTVKNNVSFEFNISAHGFFSRDTALLKTTWDINSFTFALEKKPVYTGQTVKVSGNVSIDGTPVQTLPEGLKIGITSAGIPLESEVTAGKYEFAEVPRVKATFKVVEGTKDAYEYRIKTPSEALALDGDVYDAEITQDIDIEHFASIVSCSFTGTDLPDKYWAYADLVNADNETVATQNFDMTNGCKFRGVLPGTYTINIRGRLGYGAETAPAAFTVTKGQDVTIPTITIVPDITDLTFQPLPNREDSALYGYNKYLGSVVYMNGAKLELWNEAKDQKLAESVVSIDDFGLRTRGRLGDKFVVKMSREDIYPTETTVTVTTSGVNHYSFKGLIRFIPVAHAALELKAVWNDATKATLTWEWPEAEKMKDLVIAQIELRRRVKANNEWTAVKTWEAPAMDALPTTFNDTEVAKGNQYVYEFKITYSTPEDIKTTTCEMDARFRYKLEFSVNDEKMGTITGGQPGNYLENTQIELTALPNPNYEFVAWKSGDDTVAKTATIMFNISQDTSLVAIFKNKAFKISVLSDNSEWGTVEGEGSFEFGTEVTVTATPAKGYKFVAWKENTVEVSKEAAYKFTVEKDRTLIAVFEEEVANEDLEASRWAIFAENGTLVINGLDGDRYTVYDLNGRMAGQALCTGTEIRMTVAPNQLYIVRRVSAQGAFGFKKIVVR